MTMRIAMMKRMSTMTTKYTEDGINIGEHGELQITDQSSFAIRNKKEGKDNTK